MLLKLAHLLVKMLTRAPRAKHHYPKLKKLMLSHQHNLKIALQKKSKILKLTQSLQLKDKSQHILRLYITKHRGAKITQRQLTQMLNGSNSTTKSTQSSSLSSQRAIRYPKTTQRTVLYNNQVKVKQHYYSKTNMSSSFMLIASSKLTLSSSMSLPMSMLS